MSFAKLTACGNLLPIITARKGLRVLYKFRPFRFEPPVLLYRNATSIRLTAKEGGVLLVLLENAENVVEEDTFWERVWESESNVYVDNCLRRVVSTLRKKLGDSKRTLIVTLPNRGYIFPRKVEKDSDSDGDGGRKRITLTMLPFRNLSANKRAEPFIAGQVYEISNQLSRLNPNQMSIIDPLDEHTKKTVKQVGKELGVDYVLTGAVLQFGRQLRISIKLVRAENGFTEWADTYERAMRDIPRFAREVSQDVASAIQITLSPREQKRLERIAPAQPDAYFLYLDGLSLWTKRTPESIAEAISFFKKAIARDPAFALAHAALATCHAVNASQSSVPPKEACADARAAAAEAIGIDDNSAESHATLGFVSIFYYKWGDSAREFQEALQLNSQNCALAHHWYAFYLLAANRVPEAIESVERAQDINRRSPMINTNIGTMYYYSRNYGEAIAQYNHVLSIDRDFWYAYWMRGMAYDETGQHSRAMSDYRRAMQNCPRQSLLLKACLARSLALSGNKKEAYRQVQRIDHEAGNSPIPYYHIGVAYAAVDDHNAAFRFLQQSCAAHEMWVAFVEVDPKIDGLRHDLRYKELLRALNK
jgi:TolB-like protein/Tfp pilus assembly protein PilF